MVSRMPLRCTLACAGKQEDSPFAERAQITEASEAKAIRSSRTARGVPSIAQITSASSPEARLICPLPS